MTDDMKAAERVTLWTLGHGVYDGVFSGTRPNYDVELQKRGVDFFAFDAEGSAAYVDEKVKNANGLNKRPEWLGLELLDCDRRGAEYWHGWFTNPSSITTHYSFVTLDVSDDELEWENVTEAHIASCSVLVFPKKSAEAAVDAIRKNGMDAMQMAWRAALYDETYRGQDRGFRWKIARNGSAKPAVQLNLPFEWYRKLPGATYLEDVR